MARRLHVRASGASVQASPSPFPRTDPSCTEVWCSRSLVRPDLINGSMLARSIKPARSAWQERAHCRVPGCPRRECIDRDQTRTQPRRNCRSLILCSYRACGPAARLFRCATGDSPQIAPPGVFTPPCCSSLRFRRSRRRPARGACSSAHNCSSGSACVRARSGERFHGNGSAASPGARFEATLCRTIFGTRPERRRPEA